MTKNTATAAEVADQVVASRSWRAGTRHLGRGRMLPGPPSLGRPAAPTRCPRMASSAGRTVSEAASAVGDGGDAAETHRSQVDLREEHQGRQRSGDDQPRHGHGASRGLQGRAHRLHTVCVGPQFFSVTADDEQRVVHRQPEPEHRDDVDREDGYVRDDGEPRRTANEPRIERTPMTRGRTATGPRKIRRTAAAGRAGRASRRAGGPTRPGRSGSRKK